MCDELNGSYSINWGGCCYAAYCIAKMLEQDAVNFSLVVFDEIIDLNNFNDIFDLPSAMNHYGIVIETDEEIKAINCDESDFHLNYKYYKVSSARILSHYISNDWNTYYNSNNNGLIQRIIEKTYEDFTKDLR